LPAWLKADILRATLPPRSIAAVPDSNRTVFFVSDGTGLTAEALGHSLLTQFDGIRFTPAVIPFVDSEERAREAVARIARAAAGGGARPIVFATLVDDTVRDIVRRSDALVLDFFEGFLSPLEAEFGARSTHAVGRSHSVAGNAEYQHRIEAVNYALSHDDGQSNRDLEQADVILVGVSRSGKTPTCLYLALQLGIKAANCPLIPEDFERGSLPPAIERQRHKLYGLTIAPDRLAEIRHERRPDSRYASRDNCRFEVEEAERLMRRYGIPWLNSTTRSIEEIATKILQDIKLERRVF
jgi:regulator of PEP synthase PpsR (kinase-PPPase family)